MKYLIYILPFITFSQTWVFNYDYKIPPNLTVTIDSLIGNGHTLYFTCNTALKVRYHIENIKLHVIDSTAECNESNYLKIKSGKYEGVKISDCIKVVGFKPRQNNILNKGYK